MTSTKLNKPLADLQTDIATSFIKLPLSSGFTPETIGSLARTTIKAVVPPTALDKIWTNIDVLRPQAKLASLVFINRHGPELWALLTPQDIVASPEMKGAILEYFFAVLQVPMEEALERCVGADVELPPVTEAEVEEIGGDNEGDGMKQEVEKALEELEMGEDSEENVLDGLVKDIEDVMIKDTEGDLECLVPECAKSFQSYEEFAMHVEMAHRGLAQ